MIHMLVFDLEDGVVRRFFPRLPGAGSHFGSMVLLFCMAATATVGIAYISRRYFEEPFLRMKRHV